MLYLLCVAVLLPYLAMSACVLLLGYAIGAGSLPAFFKALLTIFVLVFSWIGVAILVLLIILIGLGISTRTRWFAAAITSLAGVACVTVLTTTGQFAIGLSELLLLAPCVIAAGGAAWLTATEWPFRKEGSAARPGDERLPGGPR
ncbi:MAG: hypothetical protein ABIP44_06110 [Pseudoxanthomonas sp.]